MIWTLGAFTEWLKDRDRRMLEFRSNDILLIGCIGIGVVLVCNLYV